MKIFKNSLYYIFIVFVLSTIISCNKDVTVFVSLYYNAIDNSEGIRKDNQGNEDVVPDGNIGLTPDSINFVGIHYLEFVQDSITPYKSGVPFYKSPETFEGNEAAIDFDSLIFSGNGENIFVSNLKRIPPGTYKYLRVAVACLDYNVVANIQDIPGVGDVENIPVNFTSFLGYRTYIRSITTNSISTDIFANRALGYFIFETLYEDENKNFIYMNQVNSNAMNVVNELSESAPIPVSTAIITCTFDTPLEIIEDEDRDLYLYLNLTTNGILEFEDSNGNGQWDINAQMPVLTESVVDHGLRGISASYEFK